MGTLVSMVACPRCGAPLDLQVDRASVICIFCNTSLRVERATAPPPGAGAGVRPAIREQSVPPEQIEHVKQLLIDGKRAEAVAHYARVASVSAADAELAVDNIFLDAHLTITRHLPINAFGFVLYGVLIGLPLAACAWALLSVGESPWYWLLAVPCAALALRAGVSFVRHLGSTLVLAFGAKGNGRVVRHSILRADKAKDEYFVAFIFEVTPDDGRPMFVDQETLFTGEASLQKLAPGAVVRVRFNGARDHVFVERPITVVT